MEVTEQQRHELFKWFEAQMGEERAATMMNLMPPVGSSELATKDDVAAVRKDLTDLERRMELRLEATIERFRSELQRSFVTWLFASQAAVVTILGVLITVR